MLDQLATSIVSSCCKMHDVMDKGITCKSHDIVRVMSTMRYILCYAHCSGRGVREIKTTTACKRGNLYYLAK